MKRKAYDSDPIPSQLTHDQYKFGTRDYLMLREITKDTMDIEDLMRFVSNDDPKYKLKFLLEREGEDYSYYPNYLLNSNYIPSLNDSFNNLISFSNASKGNFNLKSNSAECFRITNYQLTLYNQLLCYQNIIITS